MANPTSGVVYCLGDHAYVPVIVGWHMDVYLIEVYADGELRGQGVKVDRIAL